MSISHPKEVKSNVANYRPVIETTNLSDPPLSPQSEEEKQFRRETYARRLKSRNVIFEKLTPSQQYHAVALHKAAKAKRVANKLKEAPLDPHGFAEIFQFVQERATGVARVRQDADVVLEIARKINSTKELIRYKESSTNDVHENVISRLEDLVMFTTGILNCKNFLGFLAYLHLYLRTFFPEPLTIKIVGYVMEALDVTKSFVHKKGQDYGLLDTQAGEDPFQDRLELLKNCITGWKDHKNSDLVKNVCNVVNILVTFGFLPDLQENPLEFNGFQLFQATAWDMQKDSVDFIEMILDTSIFFMERGHLALIHNDPTLLLYADSEAHALEKEYVLLSTALPLLEAGKIAGLEKWGDSFTGSQDFEVRLEKLISKLNGLLKVEKSPYMKNTLTNRLVVLSKVRTALIMCQKTSCIRDKPYGVLIFGPSAVAKSKLNAIIMKTLLAKNGFPSTKEHVVTLNDSDKFQSEYRACHTGVTMDDFGNTRAEHYDGSPTAKIIDFLNNVPKAALNPNVELKGNVMIQPKIVSVTTNEKLLLAHNFSNEPVSILRRFNAVLDVRLRPEYTDPDDGGPLIDKMGGYTPDAWLITLQTVRIVRCSTATGKDGFEFVDILKDASVVEVVEWMMLNSEKHFAAQKLFVEEVEEMYEMQLCKHFFDPRTCPRCAILDNQCLFEPLGDHEPSDPDVIRRVQASLRQNSFPHSLKMKVADWYVSHKLDKAISHTNAAYKSLVEGFKQHRVEIAAVAVATFAAAGAIYAFREVYLAKRKLDALLDQHGNVMQVPTPLPTDVVNPWKKAVKADVPRTLASQTAKVHQIVALFGRHLGHIYVYDTEKSIRRKCNAFPMSNNVWLLPGHMFEEKEYRIEMQTTTRDKLGRNFSQRVGPENWYRIPETDFMIIRLHNGGSLPNLAKFLPKDDYMMSKPIFAKSVWKDADGEVEEQVFKLLERKTICSKAETFEGFSYNYPRPTFEGQCMMPIISDTAGPIIVGFHLAGRTGETYGACGSLTTQQYADALVALAKNDPLTCHSGGTMPTSKYGIDYSPTDDIRPSHSCKWLDEINEQQPCVEIYGDHGHGTAAFRSCIRKSVMSDTIAEVMDLPRLHGAPSGACINKHWQRDLSLITHPKGTFSPHFLRLATDDFTLKVDKFLQANPDALELVHPYPKDVVLAGVDGVTSVDSIDLTTSMGFPINKPKKNFITPSERIVEGITRPLDIEDEYWDEVERFEEVLATGERVYAIHRANLKDEATKFTKDKIRVFAGCEFALICLTRKYYLPIVRLIQTNCFDFETAVGINAAGPEWTLLVNHLSQYGVENMVGGDYKAYDKVASPQLMFSAFEVMIHIAEVAGYTSEQITVMRGIATEISLPVYEFNGVLLAAFGSNPSGHPLTVIVNNIKNSLYMRYTWYVLLSRQKLPNTPFDKSVALVCYGDDNLLGVAESCPWFNHTAIAAVLAEIGITYTMADKGAESVPYITLNEASFLKRGFLYNIELDEWMAPIEIDSIGKSLHNYRVTKNSDSIEELAAQVVQGALREFFLHGRDVYERRSAELGKVCEVHSLEPYVGEIPSYDYMIDKYRHARDPNNHS